MKQKLLMILVRIRWADRRCLRMPAKAEQALQRMKGATRATGRLLALSACPKAAAGGLEGESGQALPGAS